jgi:hypothetical protein
MVGETATRRVRKQVMLMVMGRRMENEPMNMSRFEELCEEFRRAEQEYMHAKQDIITALGLQDKVGYGSLLKLDWNKIRHGIPPFPWVKHEVMKMLEGGNE